MCELKLILCECCNCDDAAKNDEERAWCMIEKSTRVATMMMQASTSYYSHVHGIDKFEEDTSKI
jgi:hypothetical protein|nr:MAG TPA: hypothetical protein [Bacteriophage sp.]